MSDVVAVASFFCDLAPQLGCWLAARQMHIVMLRAVMRAPLTFFDTTPIGRIISRFAKDVDVLDTSLPPQISDTIYCLFEVKFLSRSVPRITGWESLITVSIPPRPPVSSRPRSLSSARVLSSLSIGELCVHRKNCDQICVAISPDIYICIICVC